MAAEEASLEMPKGLSDGWQSHPDAVELLARAIGSALADQRDESMLSFVLVAEGLESAGNDDWARLVVQALLIRVTRRPISENPDLGRQLVDPLLYAQMLDEIVEDSGEASPLRAGTLAVAARVAMAQSDYSQAARVFHASASIWMRKGNNEAQASALIGQSAALHYLGEFDESENVSDRALKLLDSDTDQPGRVMLMLNGVQNALSAGDTERARQRLDDVRPLVESLRDGHLSTSYRLNAAALHLKSESIAAARSDYLASVRSARRRSDFGQLIVALKNLGQITYEHASPSRGIEWWEKGLGAAKLAHDWREEQSIYRTLGVSLAEQERFAEAVDAFQNALALNEKYQDSLSSARTRADLGAILLRWALFVDRTGDSERWQGLLDRAEHTTEQARLELERHRDFEWAEVTVRNLRSVWTSSDRAQEGAERLYEAASGFERLEPEYSAELLRVAALLELSEVTDSKRAIDGLIEAARRRNISDEQRAWQLATDASTVSEVYFRYQEAVKVFDSALSSVDRESHATAWANIQNDAALTAARAEDIADAERRLRDVVSVARKTHNRALLALATSNLGELAVRNENYAQARDFFVESAGLAEALGDTGRAAEAWAAIANAWVSEQEWVQASEAADRSMALADEADASEAMARAHSARASVEYSDRDFESAHALWVESASLVGNKRAGEYHAFALDCLAQLGDWRRFKSELDRFARSAQTARSQQAFVEKLHLSGLTWLQQGRPRAAGVVLAYVVLLAFEGASESYDRRALSLGGRMARDEQLVGVSAPLGAVRAFLALIEIPDNDRVQMRREYERMVTRGAKDNATDILDLVDHLISGADEDGGLDAGDD